jgi:hypothetical protein
MNGFIVGACEPASTCRCERALQGRFLLVNPQIKANFQHCQSN